MSRSIVASALALVLVGSLPAPSEAGLAGKALDAVYYVPDTVTPYSQASFAPLNFVVGAGQETVGNVEDVTNLLVDFTDTGLTITLNTVLGSPTWNVAAFNGIIFTSPGAAYLDGTVVQVDFTFDATVAEPVSIAMLATGMLTAGLVRRRRAR